MNVVITIFYVIALVWLGGLAAFAIYKKIKAKKNVKKEVEDETKTETIDSKVKK